MHTTSIEAVHVVKLLSLTYLFMLIKTKLLLIYFFSLIIPPCPLYVFVTDFPIFSCLVVGYRASFGKFEACGLGSQILINRESTGPDCRAYRSFSVLRQEECFEIFT